MNKTNIEYLDYSWNPLVMRCDRVSPGCKECWHLAMADRLSANPKISEEARRAYAGEIPPILLPDRLKEPLRVKKPTKIGVQFMGDLFHEGVPFEYIGDVWQQMAELPQHAFQVLTKRPQRMVEWFQEYWSPAVNYSWNDECLPNVWLGVTAEDQQRADERIPHLLQTPAVVRFVSVEPMLGPVDIWSVVETAEQNGVDNPFWSRDNPYWLHWLIIGCESGPKRRPMKLEWAIDLVEQCKAAGVACFVKQIPINGKVSKNPDEWPAELQVREFPEVK